VGREKGAKGKGSAASQREGVVQNPKLVQKGPPWTPKHQWEKITIWVRNSRGKEKGRTMSEERGGAETYFFGGGFSVGRRPRINLERWEGDYWRPVKKEKGEDENLVLALGPREGGGRACNGPRKRFWASKGGGSEKRRNQIGRKRESNLMRGQTAFRHTKNIFLVWGKEISWGRGGGRKSNGLGSGGQKPGPLDRGRGGNCQKGKGGIV